MNDQNNNKENQSTNSAFNKKYIPQNQRAFYYHSNGNKMYQMRHKLRGEEKTKSDLVRILHLNFKVGHVEFKHLKGL